MKSVRQIFAERLLELALSADAQHYSALAWAARRLPWFIVRRLSAVAEGKR